MCSCPLDRVYQTPTPPSASGNFDQFDDFVSRYDLRDRALLATTDEDIAQLFLENELAEGLLGNLRALLADVHDPLADRAEAAAVYGIDLLDGLADAADYDALVLPGGEIYQDVEKLEQVKVSNEALKG